MPGPSHGKIEDATCLDDKNHIRHKKAHKVGRLMSVMANDELPDWLREIRGDPPPAEAAAPEPTPVPPSEPDTSVIATDEDEELPSWLREVQASSGPQPVAPPSDAVIPPEHEAAQALDLPDLSELPASLEVPQFSEAPTDIEPVIAAPPASVEEEEDDLMRLLAEEGIDMSSLEEDRPEGSEGMSVRDWIAATSTESPLADASKSGKPKEPAQPEAPPEPEPAIVEPVIAAPPASVEEEEDDLMRLLAEEGIDMSSLEEDRPEGSEGMSVRDWIAATSTESPLADASKSGKPKEPEQFEVSPEPEPPAEPVTAAVDDDLPDWLKDDTDFETSTETVSWLADETTIDQEEPEISPVAEPPASLSDDGIVIEDELPDWLKSEATLDEPEDLASPPWLADESTSEDLVAEADTFDAAEALFSDIDAADSADLPDWLTDDTEVDEQLDAASWLTDESTHDELEAAVTSDAGLDASDDGIVIEDELPDWLRSEATLDEPEDLASPSWLTDESTQAELPVEEVAEPLDDELTAAAVEASADLSDDGMIVTDDLPDWLREGASLEDSPDDVSWLTDETELVSEVSETEIGLETAADSYEAEDIPTEKDLVDIEFRADDLPDWLQEETLETDEEPADLASWQLDASAEESLVFADSPDDGMIDVEGLPDWLKEEEAETLVSETVDDSESLPDWLAGATDDILEGEEPETLVQADEGIPDWLQESQEEAIPEEAEVSAALDQIEVEDIPAPAEGKAKVPSWLAQLREASEAEEAEMSEAQTELAAAEDRPAAESTEAEPVGPVFEKLSVAKATLTAGELDEAISIYQDLISESEALPDIIKVLTQNIASYQDSPILYETLGDAFTRDGQMSKALMSYHLALEKL